MDLYLTITNSRPLRTKKIELSESDLKSVCVCENVLPKAKKKVFSFWVGNFLVGCFSDLVGFDCLI
jgi:hypothetical protein